MRQILKITATGLIVALAASPALAQGTTPKQEQQAPRNSGSGQGGPNQPGATNTETSPATPAPPTMTDGSTPKGGAIRGEHMPRGTIHEGNTGSRDGATSGAHGTHVGTGGRIQVRQVQEALKAQGHDPGSIDGVIGPQTQEALRAYQRSQNLTETGRLDAPTTEKLGVGGNGSRSQSR